VVFDPSRIKVGAVRGHVHQAAPQPVEIGRGQGNPREFVGMAVEQRGVADHGGQKDLLLQPFQPL
jgi:hypothetical protein